MSERRFVIAEDYDVEGSAPTISESELKRRLNEIVSKAQGSNGGMSTLIDILLHGEGEKGKAYPDHGGNLWETDNSPTKPSPTPTRAEWDKWNFDEPLPSDYDKWQDWAYAHQRWILAMPIVPKE